MRFWWQFGAVAVAVVAAAASVHTTAADGPATLVVPLRPVANAPITGTATFVDLGNGRSQAIVTVNGTAAADAGPIDLHDGSCPVPGATRVALSPLAGGTSSSEVAVSVADLQGGHLAIVVHRTPPPAVADATGFLACGTIAAPTSSAPTTEDGTRAVTTGGTVGSVVLVVGAAALAVVRQRRRQRRLASGAITGPRA